MLQSELENHIKFWPQNQSRIYRYRLGFYEPHVLTLVREGDLFKIVPEYSTIKSYPVQSDESLFKEIATNVLVFHGEPYYGFDPVRLRTGGCECGAFINNSMHYRNCPLYRGY